MCLNSSAPKSTKRRNPRKRNNRRGRDSGIGAAARVSTSMQPSRNPVLSIRRATTRQLLATYGAIDGSVASTIQLTFSPGATNYRLGGTSLYSDALPNSAEFSNLFDDYKIKKITMRIDAPNAWTNSGPTPVFLPNIIWAIDRNDGGDAVISDLLQYPQAQIHSFYQNGYTPLMFSFSPVPLRDIAGSGVSTSYGAMPSPPYIRTAEMVTPHYGVKMALDFASNSQIYTIPLRFTVWYDLEFINPK